MLHKSEVTCWKFYYLAVLWLMKLMIVLTVLTILRLWFACDVWRYINVFLIWFDLMCWLLGSLSATVFHVNSIHCGVHAFLTQLFSSVCKTYYNVPAHCIISSVTVCCISILYISSHNVAYLSTSCFVLWHKKMQTKRQSIAVADRLSLLLMLLDCMSYVYTCMCSCESAVYSMCVCMFVCVCLCVCAFIFTFIVPVYF